MAKKPAAYRAAFYLRLSRDDDAHGESQSIANQRKLLSDYASRNGYAVVAEYADDGWSGTTFERPKFQQMLRDIDLGLVNMVLVKDLSRLGRDYIQTGRYLELIFPEKNVRFIAVNDGIDTAHTDSDMTPFRNVVNELYARDASRKIRSALRAKMQAGQFIGNFAPFGYQKDPNDKNRLLPDERSAAVVRQIFIWAAAGKKTAEIVRMLNARGEASPAAYRCMIHPELNVKQYTQHPQWTASSVGRILTDRVYLGCTVQGKTDKLSFKSKKTRERSAEEWIIVPGQHEPLVSQQTFDAVQRQRSSRRCSRKGAFENLFSGLAFCADCGKAMSTVGTRKKGAAASLACGAYKLRGSSACTNHFIAYEALYACVLKAVRTYVCLTEDECKLLFERLHQRLRLDTRQHEAAQERERLQNELDGVQRLLAQLYEDRSSGKIGETNFYPLLQRYEEKTTQLCQEIEQLHSKDDDADCLHAQQERLREIIRRYTDIRALTPSLLFELIERIEVHQGVYVSAENGKHKRQKVTIQFRFLPEPYETEAEMVQELSSSK